MKKPSLTDDALSIMLEPSPLKKVQKTFDIFEKWKWALAFNLYERKDLPSSPARPDKPELCPPNQVPKRRINSSNKGKATLIHALAHIELNAIDLAWDIIARFPKDMPNEFYKDWSKVAYDEAKHFIILNEHLKILGYSYGDFSAHNGLWEMAQKTKDNLQNRLALVPMVLEARGLDVTPVMIEKFKKLDDHKIVSILSIIYHDEINHVYIGQKWFRYLCDQDKTDAIKIWRGLVNKYLNGQLKPPFNEDARKQAGLEKAFYAS